MQLSRKIIKNLMPLTLIALSACATTPFKADVSRFQAMPAPSGQTFTIQSLDPKLQGGLEFAQYADLVRSQLQSRGYQPASSPAGATLVVNVDYGVDNGQTKVVSRPGLGGGFGYGRYGRYGRYRSPFYWGWDDPFWYSPWGYPEVDSYTVFTSHLDMTITRAADNRRLFEGKAKARSTSDSLPTLVPNLITAMFTNFPGRSGEEVRITVPPPAKESGS